MSAPMRPPASKWRLEEERRPLVQRAHAQYVRGLFTLDELIAELARIRLDEVGWCNPGATFPDATIQALGRLMAHESRHVPRPGPLH